MNRILPTALYPLSKNRRSQQSTIVSTNSDRVEENKIFAYPFPESVQKLCDEDRNFLFYYF